MGHGAIDGGVGYTYFDQKAGHEFSAVLGFTGNLGPRSCNNWTAENALSASQQSVMPLASKQDRKTSGKSRTQADLSHLDRRMTPGCSQRQGPFIMCDY